MSIRDKALNLLLWYAIFAWGIWLGGTVYQMVVVVPMWSASPPESVRAFFQGTSYNHTIFHFFGPPFMAARLIPTIIALALAWHLPKHRFRRKVGIESTCGSRNQLRRNRSGGLRIFALQAFEIVVDTIL